MAAREHRRERLRSSGPRRRRATSGSSTLSTARFEDFEAKTYLEGEHGFLFIQQQKNGMKGEKLLDLRLGIWPDTVELLERHGYEIIPRYRDGRRT